MGYARPIRMGAEAAQHAGTEEPPQAQKAPTGTNRDRRRPGRPGLAQGRRPESSLNRYEFAELAAQADTEHPEALRRINAS